MNYKLVKTKKKLDKIYHLICEKISSSIFVKLGFDFFNYLVLKNIICVYCIKKGIKISAVITTINYKYYKSINRIVLNYLIFNPLIIIINFFYLIKSVKKSSIMHINNDYLHLLHLVIIKKDFLKITLKKKDLMFNRFYKKILVEQDANVLFLCFEKKNKRAYKYYLRNKFRNFYKTGNLLYFKKNFKT